MHKYLKVFLVFALAIASGVALFKVFNLFNYTATDSETVQTTEDTDRRKPRRPHPPRPPHPPRDEFSPRVFEALDLTDEQKSQIENLQAQQRTTTEEFEGKIRSFDEQLENLADAEAFDETAARQILTDKAQTETDIQLSHLKTAASIKGLLNDEQKAQVEEMRKPRWGFMRRPLPPRENE